MGNRKPKQVTTPAMPTSWDMGAMGPANRHNLITEEAAHIDPETGKATNPNGVKRMRRVDMLEIWHRKGEITTAGFNAAEKLRNAFERTECAPGWPDNDRVQYSPKPDHAVAIQIDRISAFHHIARHTHPDDRAIIGHCVLSKGIPATLRVHGVRPYHGRGYDAGLRHLSDALDRLANAIS